MGGGQDDPPSVPGAQPGRKPGKEQGRTEAPTANTKIPPRASCSYRKNRLQLNKHINSFVKRDPTFSANHLGVVHLQYHPVRVAPRDFSPHLHKPTLLHFLLGRNLTGSGSILSVTYLMCITVFVLISISFFMHHPTSAFPLSRHKRVFEVCDCLVL